mmetsp:Transcript_7430/g.28149  ORF Transcript_7430/g.28149 Transcript_7430/m.28149 type:complete len:446 (-) Transcript_7430:769-2106(-)
MACITTSAARCWCLLATTNRHPRGSLGEDSRCNRIESERELTKHEPGPNLCISCRIRSPHGTSCRSISRSGSPIVAACPVSALSGVAGPSIGAPWGRLEPAWSASLSAFAFARRRRPSMSFIRITRDFSRKVSSGACRWTPFLGQEGLSFHSSAAEARSTATPSLFAPRNATTALLSTSRSKISNDLNDRRISGPAKAALSFLASAGSSSVSVMVLSIVTSPVSTSIVVTTSPLVLASALASALASVSASVSASATFFASTAVAVTATSTTSATASAAPTTDSTGLADNASNSLDDIDLRGRRGWLGTTVASTNSAGWEAACLLERAGSVGDASDCTTFVSTVSVSTVSVSTVFVPTVSVPTASIFTTSGGPTSGGPTFACTALADSTSLAKLLGASPASWPGSSSSTSPRRLISSSGRPPSPAFPRYLFTRVPAWSYLISFCAV